MPKIKNDELITANEAAKLLYPNGVSPTRMRYLLKNNVFPHAHKYGNRWFITRADLNAENFRRTHTPGYDSLSAKGKANGLKKRVAK